MQKIILLFLLATSVLTAQEGIQFREGTLNELIQFAKDENKPLMLMCYAEWCPHCTKMKSEVVIQPEVAAFFNENFVCASKDMEKGDGKSIRRQLRIKSYPTFAFINPDGKLIYQVAKGLTAADFIAEGKNALDESKQFPTLRKVFMADPANAENCLAYIQALKKGNLDVAFIALKYFSAVPEEKLVSEINWRIFANGISDISSREFQHVLKNQDKYAAVSSPTRVERKILHAVRETLSSFAESGDTLNYNKVRPAVAAINLRKTDSLLFNYDLKVYELANDWNRYKEAALEGAAKFAWDNANALRDITLNFSKNINDKPALEKSIKWAERSLELKTAYDIHLILAHLNLKAGQKESARNWAEKGRAMAVQNDWDPIRADEILNQI